MLLYRVRARSRIVGAHGVLLLTIQIHHNLVQIKVLEIEGITLPIAVVSAIVDQSDHDARGQLTGKVSRD